MLLKKQYLLGNRIISSTCLLIPHVALRLRIDGLQQGFLGLLGERHGEHDVDLEKSLNENSIVPGL